MSNQKEPSIRFSEYTDEWEQRKLGEITERVRGNDGRMDLPTLTISASLGWLDQRERFSGNIAGKEQKNYTLLKKGELSYNHGNSKLAKYGVVFSLNSFEEALVPRVYHSFKTKKNTNADFIEYMFATKRPDRELGKLVSSGARMDGLLNINYDEFMGISIILPCVEEQQKIGQFFKQLDDTIALHQRELDSLNVMKKSLLNKMFPKNGESVPEIRFPGFTDAWEQRKFSNIVNRVSQQSNDSNLPKVEFEDIISGEGRLNKDISNKFDGRKGTVFEPEFILYGKLRPYLKNWLFPNFKGIALGDFWVFEPNNSSSIFDYYLIQSDKYQTVANLSSGTKMPRSDWKTVSETEFSIPVNIEEQVKIGNFFKHLDDTIALHQRELDSLEEMKKTLLKEMFI